MTRILMIGMPAAGHVNPCVPLILELVRRGIDVTFYITEEFRSVVEQSRATFRAYPAGPISLMTTIFVGASVFRSLTLRERSSGRRPCHGPR